MQKMFFKSTKGFTLIELLVVISIIGFLTTLAVVSLNTARVKSRDGKRLSDMKQLNTAMELCLTSNSGANEGTYTGCCTSGTYPVKVNACGGSLSTYIQSLANFKDPATSASTAACGATPSAICEYGMQAAPGASYTVNFWQEGSDGAGSVGPAGITR